MRQFENIKYCGRFKFFFDFYLHSDDKSIRNIAYLSAVYIVVCKFSATTKFITTKIK